MAGHDHPLRQRAELLRFRVHSLTGLRALVALPRSRDLTERQWSLLEPRLAATAARLADRTRRAAERWLPRVHEPDAARALNAALGRIELDVASAFTFFDTYMDVLTQRRSPELGEVLARLRRAGAAGDASASIRRCAASSRRWCTAIAASAPRSCAKA